jgi:hypothetical protein
MSDVGGGADVSGVGLTLDDEAAGTLPNGTRISSGSYKPTQGTAENNRPRPASLPSPAPAGPYGTSLSVLDGADPNGTYSLYVYDDAAGDAGQLASGFSLDIKTTADPPTTNPPTDVPPDLRMARLRNLQIQSTSGRKLLRFDSIVVNVGAGSFEARGSRPDTSSTDMTTVTQRIYNDQGGHKDIPTTARMYFAGDGHSHWHLRDLETYELSRLDNGVKVGTGAKHGFCFYDNYRFGSTEDPYYGATAEDPPCGTNQPNALTVTMGLSRGWGDIYRRSLPDQYIDITGLTSGRYKLQVTADEANWFTEGNNSNNFTWVDINISGTSVSVIRHGPSAQAISG